jgi:tyrosinase
MRIDITVANEGAAGRNYLTWAPVKGTVRLLDGGGAEGRHEGHGEDPVTVTLSNDNPQVGGQLEFAAARDQTRSASLDLVLSPDGTPVDFWVAGVVGKPSSADGDAVIRVAKAGAPEALRSKAVMVRIRKNANQLSPAERDRFTTTLAILNDQGAGLFKDFREMHRLQLALVQAHGNPGFLSWHRAYLLDLERELQIIEPSVTLPYWRFDQPAPNVFSADLMGAPGPGGTVVFNGTNLLRLWQTDGAPGVTREPGFDVQTARANVISQGRTLGLGGDRPNAIFDRGPNQAGFDTMEFNPHGNAHTSFVPPSWIRSPGTAPRDPVFFLLHCNVDRLWARWQWFHNRFDGTQPNTYFFRGSATSTPAALIGHNLLDTMWPWNNVTGFPRPDNAPRTPFPSTPTATAPDAAATVGDMIDYLGLLNAQSHMNFAYDDVPFGLAPSNAIP